MTRPLQICAIVSCLMFFEFSCVYAQNSKTGRYYYIGAVGNKPAQMDVTFDGNQISGHLYFVNGESPLKVDGSVLKNHIKIDTKGPRKISGNMKGKTSRDHTEINGEWAPLISKKNKKFHFIKVAEYLKSNIQQGTLISLSAIYPYFIFSNHTGQLINSKLQDSVLNRQRSFLKDGQQMNSNNPNISVGWKQKISYEITYFSPDLISIAGNIYLYTGGAHGITNPLTNNFYINNGRVRQLQLGDLFRPGSTYEEYLSRLCLNNLNKKGATWIKNGEVTHLAEPDLRHFTISPHGLTFYFPPYMVGPYSDGSFTVDISFDSLGDYLDAEGPLQDLLSIPHN